MSVLCLILMQLTPTHYNAEQVWGHIIRDNTDTKWFIDISDYLNKHPFYKEWNTQTQIVNSNDCLYLEKP